MHKNLPYRAGVGIMLINKNGKVFVAKRIDTKAEAWQMPQGGIDDGEDAKTAALREMLEEIGTNKAEIIGESDGWYSYDLPDNLIPTIWGGKFRGQRQKWFALRFLGDDTDINIETDHPEFCEWQWAEPNTLPDLIVPFKRKLYENLVAEFSPLF
jgi:putative (di)nucleoside polyphosphate hydrolase